MNPALSRTDDSILAHWWWTIDRQLFSALLTLVLVGMILLLAASPSTAERVGLPPNHFVIRQIIILPAAMLLMLSISMLSLPWIRRLGVVLLLGTYVMLVLTPIIGQEIKGAKRWIHLGFFSLQASEFLKPALAITCAWMFTEWKKSLGWVGLATAFLLYAFGLNLLLLQPDIGMAVVISCVWLAQFFLAGMPLFLLVIGIPILIFMALGAYTFFPHVQSRVDRFLNPETGDTFQIDQSLRAITSGGWFGKGPGEGTIKHHLPDAHADFVFSVAAEEFGLIACLLILGLFLYIFLRAAKKLLQEQNLFVVLACGGLLVQFMMQAFINIASSVGLIPTKGMTLPFISYGGSSLLAMSITMGTVLALTRKRAV